MSLKPEYFRYLDHFGSTVTLRELHADPRRRDVIALRHDVDHDIDLALEAAHHEHARGIRATYYILHTAPYWNDPDLSSKLRQLEAYGHEVGFHCNVATEWAEGKTDDVSGRVAEALRRLRAEGVSVFGTSAHGDRVCYRDGFINYWIWKELRPADPAACESGRSAEGIFVDDERWRVKYPAGDVLRVSADRELPLWSVSLAAHGLEYDATHVPHDRYWTDSGGAWTRSDDPLGADLSTGRHQVLMHPWWWRGARKTIFVLSTARSGSRWLSEFVDKATSCRGYHEWTLNHDCSVKPPRPDKRTDHEYLRLIEDEPLAAARIKGAIEHFGRQKPDVLEANVYLEPFLEQLREHHPEIPLVHLHRDGRDVVRSLINRGWYDTPDDPRHREAPTFEWGRQSQFERACSYYRFTNERLLRFCFQRLSFERMVGDLDYLTEFLKQFDIVVHPLLAARLFGRPSNASRSYDFPKYAEWPERHRRSFDDICGSVQGLLGYDIELRASAPPPRWKRTLRRAARGLRFAMAILAGKPWNRRLEVSTSHLGCVREMEGLRLTFPANPSPNAHAVLARGSWQRLSRECGTRCAANRYHQVEIDCGVPANSSARVFALFYDRQGRQLGQRALGYLRNGSGVSRFSFAPEVGSSHFALALHVGAQTSPGFVVVRSMAARGVRFPSRYRVRMPPPAEDREDRKAA